LPVVVLVDHVGEDPGETAIHDVPILFFLEGGKERKGGERNNNWPND
jgi:hypothetical protein